MLRSVFLIVFSFVFYAQAEIISSEEESHPNAESSIEREENSIHFQSFDYRAEKLVSAEELDAGFIEKNSDAEAFWNADYELKSFSSEGSNEALIKVELLGKLKWQLIQSLFVHTKGLIVGRSGHTQSVLDRTDRASGLHVLEFYFQWSAFSNFSVLQGIIEQGFLSAPLLITDKAFPSVIGEWSVDSFSDFDFKFLFQLAIANNFTEQAKRAYDIQKAPLFMTSSLFLDSNDFFDISIKENFTVFHYYNLPFDIAQESKVYGNYVDGSDSSAGFRYSFFGFHNNLSFQKVLSDLWAVSAGVGLIYNLMAPETHNEGFRIYSSVYHNYKETMEIKLTGELFANQSDTSVAYYNSETYGHNNRKGFLARAESHFFRSGLTLETEFVYSEPINFGEQSTIREAYSFAIALKTNDIAI